MNGVVASALACLALVMVGAVVALRSGTAGGAIIGVRAANVGLLGLAVTGVVAAQRMGDCLASRKMPKAFRDSSVLVVSGCLVAIGGILLDTAVELSPTTTAGLASWYVFGPPLEFTGYALVAMAVFTVVREMPRPSLLSPVRARTSSAQERVRSLVVLGAPLFVIGPFLAFVPVYRAWGSPSASRSALTWGWQDAIFPYRAPGILTWMVGTCLLVFAGLLTLREGHRPTRRRQGNAIQVLLVAGLVLSTGFAADVIASTPPSYVILIPTGRVLQIEASGGDPLAYFFNITTTTGHVTGSWQSNENLMPVFLNGDYPTDTRGECPPPSPPTYGPPAMNGTIDQYFPPVWHAELTWFCVAPPASITITAAIVVSYT